MTTLIEQERGKIIGKDAIKLKLATYEQSMESIRSLINTGLQILSALTAANVAILGFAISSQKAMLFGVGSAIMIIGIVLHRSVRIWMMPYVYSAVLTEQDTIRDVSDPTLSFASMFFRYPKFLDKIESFIELHNRHHPVNRKEQADLLAKLAAPSWMPDHLGSYALFCFAAVAEAIAVPVSYLLGWKFI
jgi:hypothetical protein